MVHIVVVGSINMDLVVSAERIPIPGETVLGHGFNTFPGGKGANQAVAATRQGAAVTFLGSVGDDPFGEELLNGLKAEHIETRNVLVCEDSSSGVALITLDSLGQNCIVVASGANSQLTPWHIQQKTGIFSDADVLLLQLETPLDTVIAAAQQAKELGVIVVLNPAPAQPLPKELLPLVDVLVPNESETALLTGQPVETMEQVESAAQGLIAQGVGSVVITLGSRGALLVTKGVSGVHVPAFSVEVVDTTAAGDSFVGAFAVGLAEGLPMEKSVLRGCAAGALAVTCLGAQPSIPHKKDVDELIASRMQT
jgi:ribokinase